MSSTLGAHACLCEWLLRLLQLIMLMWIFALLEWTVCSQVHHHGIYFTENQQSEILFNGNIQLCLQHYMNFQSAIDNIHRCFITKFYLCRISYNYSTDTVTTYNASLRSYALLDQTPLHYLPSQGYLLPFCGVFGNFWTFLESHRWFVNPVINRTFINKSVTLSHPK